MAGHRPSILIVFRKDGQRLTPKRNCGIGADGNVVRGFGAGGDVNTSVRRGGRGDREKYENPESEDHCSSVEKIDELPSLRGTVFLRSCEASSPAIANASRRYSAAARHCRCRPFAK